MSTTFETTEHPIGAAWGRTRSLFMNLDNLAQLTALILSVCALWLFSFIPLTGWLVFVVYLFAIPYAGVFLLNQAQSVFTEHELLPPWPTKSDLWGAITPGVAHAILLVGFFIDIFPTSELLLAWGAALGLAFVPLNHGINGGFPRGADWVWFFVGGLLCSLLGASIVAARDLMEGWGPLRTLVPLLGALVINTLSASLARELT